MLDLYAALIRDTSLVYPPAVHALAQRAASDTRILSVDQNVSAAITSMTAHSGVAVLNVSGVLIEHRDEWELYGYCRSYDTLSADLLRAVNDTAVKTIVLHINSPGGDVAGCFEFCDEIVAARVQKPVIAVVDSMACSAAYAIAASADQVIVPPSGMIGSIGVVATHFDISKMLQDAGVSVTHLYAGDRKIDGTPYEPLSEGARTAFVSRIQKTYDVFVNHVARTRGMDVAAVKATQAGVYDAEQATTLGLADHIMSANQAFTEILAAEGRAE